MTSSHRFSFPLPNGLHARPASHLVEAARPFGAAIIWVNERSGRTANAKSVLGLVGTDTRHNDPCRIEITGADADSARAALAEFVAGALVRCDEPLVDPTPAAGSAAAIVVPRALKAAGLVTYESGDVACRGLGWGVAVILDRAERARRRASDSTANCAQEQARFTHAVETLAAEYARRAELASGAERGVLLAHLGILRDPVLTDDVVAEIGRGRTAEDAIVAATDRHRAVFGQAESTYLRERTVDIDDVTSRLLEALGCRGADVPVPVLTEPSVVLADALTPSQLLALDRKLISGLVLAAAGKTSHVIILARSFGIPTLTGVTAARTLAPQGAEVIVDAHVGIVVAAPPAAVRAFYETERAKLDRIAATQAAERDRPAMTMDGRRIEVAANVASVEEVTEAFARGADAIGLFRTELLFAHRAIAPTEDEQFEAYAAAVRAAAGRPVTIRTLDVGGDKPVPFLRFPAEANPFLGYRGVRFYAEHSGLVKTQLRALLRAAALGPLQILVPMVARVEEARLVRRLLAEAREELQQSGRPCAQIVPLGLMLEVPSVAFVIGELCAEVDFFSIGTNDLAQYFFAADRENARVAEVNDPLQPGFLRLLGQLVREVRSRGGRIGLCGELAENTAALPLLVGLGLDELSLAAPRIGGLKAAIAKLDAAAAEEQLAQAMQSATRADVARVLASGPRHDGPLFATELVLDEVTAASKAGVIRAMVDALHEAGRTEQPTLVEEAIWRREETYSTGFGDGFALPHGKSDALRANSIVVARLREPVDWQSLDGQPVDVVILLAIRESDHGRAHLETLARLSRLVMREEFRSALRAQKRAAGVITLLAQADRPAEAVTA